MIDRYGGRQGQTAVDLFLGGALHQFVEKAADLAHVARRFRQSLLARIEFLEHGHRDVNVVLFEAENGGGIVHQDIRVEHENSTLRLALTALQHSGPQRPHIAGHSAFTAANTASA